MKKLFSLAVVTFIAMCTHAQTEKSKEDTLKIKFNGSKILIFEDNKSAAKDTIKKEKKKKGDFTHWKGFDIGICALTTADNKISIPSNEDIYNTNQFLDLKYNRSWYFSLNVFEKNIRLYKNYLNLVTGAGVEWNSYCFANKMRLNPDAETVNISTSTFDVTPNTTYIKNQLKAAYVKVPLLLEFNTNTNNARKSFHLAAGMEFAYKLSSWTKQVMERDGEKLKYKNHDDYNLNSFKYGITVRAGYGKFTAFANYSLATLFEKDKGPETLLYPVSVGVTLISF